MKKRLKNILKISLILLAIFIILNKLGIVDIDSFSNRLKELKQVDEVINQDFDKIKYYNDRIILYNNEEGIIYANEDIIPIDAGLSDKKIVFGKDQIYIVDKEFNIIKALDLNGEEIDTYFLEKDIFKLEERYNKLLIHYKANNIETVEICDLKAEKIKEHSVEKWSILTFDINDKSSNYVLSILDFSNDQIKSILEYQNIKGENIWNITFPDEIVMKTHFMNNNILVITDENIHFIDNGKIIWSKKIDDINKIEVKDSLVYLLYNNTLEVVNMEGKTVYKLGLKRDYDRMIFFKDNLILFGERNILGIKDGEKILEHINESKILDIAVNNESIAILNKDYVKTYQLKNLKK